ncbi:TrbG/VirB9 family P-type conjugative transfer protein [Sphingomonas sp.]|uniref:TrbG/VirB9 family P-type conjugative transfer protein n=1 Tax=Sphingomonas sp. TaxID=28214 RepID=UPI003B3A75B9
MRPSLPILTLLSLAAASAAYAADTRIVTRRYDPATIVTVAGQVGTQATIAFGDDERIENVAVGDSTMWQVTPNKRADLLFVKPVVKRARTNMTVVTDQRTYLFDLVANGVSQPVYVLRFSYPDKPKPVQPVVVAVQAPPPPAQPDPSTLNFRWKSAGSRQLVPTRVFDDGKAVYLGWPAEVPMPAILVRDVKGLEGPVNYSLKGDYVVVEGVPGQLVLRSGKEMATLTVEPSAPIRTAANTATQTSAH